MMFNDNNVQRIDVMSQTIKNYEEIIQKLEVLVLYKLEKEREVFKELILSDNTFNYFLHMIKKDCINFEINQLKDVIENQKRDLDRERMYLKKAL